MASPDLLATAAALLASGRRDEAVSIVAVAASNGEGSALFQQAIWRLVGTPLVRDIVQARIDLSNARLAGHESAALLEAALLANGSGSPPSWSEALTILRSIAPHSPTAQFHLRLLDEMAVASDGSPINVRQPSTVGQRPHVGLFRGLLTANECAEVANSVHDILAPAVVADPNTGRPIAHPVRTSDGAVVGPTRENLVIRAINLRLAAITATDVSQGESLMVLRYAPGQQYRPHMDTLPNVTNQRVMTMLIYLNEDYEGGETRFEASGLTIKGRVGDAIVFDNVSPDGAPDRMSLHTGMPVLRGTKWLATRWIRARALDPWNPATAA